ncbi:MAG: hypothetical protein PVH42_20270 [Desulfobacterales bacterium]
MTDQVKGKRFYVGQPHGQIDDEKRETQIARVAPILLGNDTMTSPTQLPNRAPAVRVMMAAPGRESAVTAT